jgi:hypothetical protein
MRITLMLFVAFLGAINAQANYGNLIFSEEFDTFDLSVWRHDLTLSGGNYYFFYK